MRTFAHRLSTGAYDNTKLINLGAKVHNFCTTPKQNETKRDCQSNKCKSKYSVSELRRNNGVRGRYNWETAQSNVVQTKRKKPDNHSINKDVMEEAKHLLVTEQWSPDKYPVYWPRMARTVIHLLSLFKEYFKSITTDNGPEFAAHKDITKYLGVPVYFSDPYLFIAKGSC